MRKTRAFDGITEPLGRCRTAGSAATTTRVGLSIRIEADGATTFEGVEVFDSGALNPGELDCIRQTMLARELELPPVKPMVDDAQTTTMVMDLTFDGGGRVKLRGVRRGPHMHLLSGSKDGRDIVDAVSACGQGPVTLRLVFDEDTGAVVSIAEEPPSTGEGRGGCAAAALKSVVIPGPPFEPHVPEDRTLICEFLGTTAEPTDGYTCRRLGPKGGYIPVDD